MLSLHPTIQYLLAIIVSTLISAYTVRKTIFITRKMKIYDVPDKIRKIHGDGIPSLGGIGVFTSYLIVAVFFWPGGMYLMPAILASSVILFFAGIYDDLSNMKPAGKLVAQIIASFITAYFAEIRIGPFLEGFGIMQMPHSLDIILTIIAGTFFINVFNFIDGIDGLACTLAICYMGTFGLVFANVQGISPAGIAFALAGAAAGLLFFNAAPAKIYMGDTGSMFIGFTVFNFALVFVRWDTNAHFVPLAHLVHGASQAAALNVALLFMPIYDGIRVFILRISRGISPLKADRTHLHYYLLDAGCTHTQAVAIIAGTNMLLVLIAWLIQDMHPLIVLSVITAVTSLMVFVVYTKRQKKLSGAAGRQ